MCCTLGYGSVGGFNESNFVYVDPHVLSTPVLADVNNDGDVELVMAVSYYFDKFAIEHPDKLGAKQHYDIVVIISIFAYRYFLCIIMYVSIV